MKRSFNKAERFGKIQLLLVSVPGGLTRSELAKRLDTSRPTISRDIAELSHDCPIAEDENTGKLFLDKISLLTSLHLNAEEIQAMHLACRLLGRKVRFHYPSASSALRKLGAALEGYASPLAESITSTAGLFEDHDSDSKSGPSGMLKTITEGIVSGLSVRFERYSRRERLWKESLFSSYCIEPYAEGNSLYLVGLDEDASEIRTIKFELIRDVSLTDHPYSIPDSFCADSYFRKSWGIWTSDRPAVRVVLGFSADVRERVLQTEWHRSEETEILPDGRLVWKAFIAQPVEMLPWIRGWGRDAVVIEPSWLREKLLSDAEACIANYDIRMLSEFEK